MATITCFGEIMLRLSPPDYSLIEQSNQFAATFGGSEANIAVALACLGNKVEFLTKLPKNQLGDGAIRHLRSYGVGLSALVREHQNMGIYFLENGFGGRPAKVIYNRRHSAFTTIKSSDFNFDEIFKDTKWFHISGISLALSPSAAETALTLIKEAKHRQITVSFDVNYRARLWDKATASKHLTPILKYVDVLFANYFDATEIFNIVPKGKETDAELLRADVFAQLIQKYQLTALFSTDRTVHSASENSLTATLYTDEGIYQAKTYRFNIFDRVGGGDAFASGVIHSLFNAQAAAEACEFGLALSVMKHTIAGDAAVFKVNEVEAFMNEKNSGISR